MRDRIWMSYDITNMSDILSILPTQSFSRSRQNGGRSNETLFETRGRNRIDNIVPLAYLSFIKTTYSIAHNHQHIRYRTISITGLRLSSLFELTNFGYSPPFILLRILHSPSEFVRNCPRENKPYEPKCLTPEYTILPFSSSMRQTHTLTTSVCGSPSTCVMWNFPFSQL